MKINPTATEVIGWLEQNQADFTDMSDKIWEKPELAWHEFFASHLQAKYLENQGFSITWNVAGMNTAFIAEWGKGKPVLGFIGEYDALPGLSQKKQPRKEAIEEGAPGQGCGHNLLGTAAVASAAAVKTWMQEHNTPGTIRYYGCPAEEKGSGKVFMALAGAFDDLDAALNFHPASFTMACKGQTVGINAIYYRFTGRSAHAGGSPHKGRSALDAVELMNVGVNYLREHVKDDVRMHYIITNGGKAPNIVPEKAEVYYFIRAAKPDYLAEVVERVNKVARGAAMMTETSVEIVFDEGCSPLVNNHTLSDLQYQALKLAGPVKFSKEEIQYAQQINDAFPGTNADYIEETIEHFKPSREIVATLESCRDKPLLEEIFPALDEGIIETGSTDVGDLSQVAPVSMLLTTCFSTGVPGHNWGDVATAGMSIGHKGMMLAAKAMAITAVDLLTVPEHLQTVREEFEQRTHGKPYISPIPAGTKPPVFQPPAK